MAASSDQGDKIIEVSESDENIQEVSGSDENTREVSESDENIQEATESDSIVREFSESGEMIRETSHSGDTTQTIFHGNRGHTISYKFSVINLHTEKSRGFQAYFGTECHIFPTSWLCEMLFEKVADDNTACILFKLKRTDSANGVVSAYISLNIKDATTVPLFCSPSMNKNAVHPGEIVDGHLIKKFRTPEEVSYFNTKLYVSIDISVVSCHFVLDRDPVCVTF